MVQSHAIHHLHKRKRVHQKLEPYPHPDKTKRFVDRLVYISVFLGPIMTVPQVMTIWIEQNASGVSLVSWIAYTLISIPWFVYGILHKDSPITISSILWVVLGVPIIIGIYLYG